MTPRRKATSDEHRDTVLAHIGLAWELDPFMSLSEVLLHLIDPFTLEQIADDEWVECCQEVFENEGKL